MLEPALHWIGIAAGDQVGPVQRDAERAERVTDLQRARRTGDRAEHAGHLPTAHDALRQGTPVGTPLLAVTERQLDQTIQREVVALIEVRWSLGQAEVV